MEPSTRPPGRPRSDTATHAILAAAFAQLVERGWGGFAIEAVAERAGVGKATIYRWWPDRAALALDAFFVATSDTLAFPETPCASDAFRRQIMALAELLRGPVGSALVAMVAGAREHDAIGRAMGERWIGPRRAWGRERLARAVAEGECPAGLDLDAALAALYSPLYAPLLLGQGVEPAHRIEAYLAIVFRGIFKGEP